MQNLSLVGPAFQLMPSHGRNAVPADAGRHHSDLGKLLRRVAIVEDELLVAFDLEAMLENLSFEVVGIFPNGEDAVAALAHAPVDLLCMDINLGRGIDGIEAARRIRERQASAVLFISAYSDSATKARISEVTPGAHLLSKPVTELMLGNAIRSLTNPIN